MIEIADGRKYIVKCNHNPQGPNLLANEFIGRELARSAGLPVADAARIRLSEEFLEQNRDLEFYMANGTRRIRAGVHFGTRFIESEVDRTYQFISVAKQKHLLHRGDSVGIALLDILIRNDDCRQAVYHREANQTKILQTFIDFGHAFGGPHWGSTSEHWPYRHFVTSRCPDLWTERRVTSWIAKFQQKLPKAFKEARKEVPIDWYVGNIDRLETNFEQALRLFPARIDALFFAEGPQVARSPQLSEPLGSAL